MFTLFSFSFFFFFSFLRTIAVQARIVVKNNTRLFTRTQRERWQSKSERLLGTRLENRRNLESEEESKSRGGGAQKDGGGTTHNTKSSASSSPSSTSSNKEKGRPRFKVTDDVRLPNRTFTIVTTAALPWMTGTSVNPLLRAAYLANSTCHDEESKKKDKENIKRKVALVVPWLPRCDQKQVFPKRQSFNHPEEQAVAMMEWVTNRVDFARRLKFFFAGRYATDKGSIVPVGNIIERIPMRLRDVAILEEPEHLNWFHCGRKGWKQEFNLVVGIIHTNYLEYARREENGEQKEAFIRG